MYLPKLSESGISSLFSFDSLLSSMDPSTFRGLAVLFVVFVVMLFIGFSRRFFITSSLKSIWSGMIMGIFLILVLEAGGFWFYKNYIVGGKTETLPNSLQAVLQDSRENMEQVLGITTVREMPTAQSVMQDFRALSKLDAQLVVNSICSEKK